MVTAIPHDDTPFVLLDDARANGAKAARLYVDPAEVIVTRKAGEVLIALDALRTATRGGLHAAGFVGYDAGAALHDLPDAGATGGDLPLIWFGLFRGFTEIAASQVAALLPDRDAGWAGAPQPRTAYKEYEDRFARIRELIVAGDIYQANLTFRSDVPVLGSPAALYAGLRERSRAGFGALIHTGRDWLMSLSPELFFEMKGDAIVTRPMKGTVARSSDPAVDAQRVTDLGGDPKQQAENLMIVDLLRNDLSRVAVPGSVAVPELFAVETYPTLHQMTSTVTARLGEDRDAVDALTALFPCGSITGAPKLRAMEIIGEVEKGPRGIYTGAIGRLDPGGDAAFNVAIRTLHIKAGASAATLGLGSAVTADSAAQEEWRECLLKGRFAASTRRFDLIETMAFDPHDGVMRLDVHMARLSSSADALGFTYDRHAVRNELQAATFRLREGCRVRLLLSRSGAVSIETHAMPPVPVGPVEVALRPLPVSASDFRLRHKTTDRAFYDTARDQGMFETIFTDAQGRVTEGSITNVFVKRGDVLLTPPLALGLLPGILRTELIAEGRAREAELMPHHLEQGLFIGNSLRGLLPARLSGL